MLRDKNLIPLSRQHQHALALCVRLDRAVQSGQVDAEAWQAEIQQIFEQEIGTHFDAEERELFPAAASRPELRSLVEELLDEHEALRQVFACAATRRLTSPWKQHWPTLPNLALFLAKRLASAQRLPAPESEWLPSSSSSYESGNDVSHSSLKLF